MLKKYSELKGRLETSIDNQHALKAQKHLKRCFISGKLKPDDLISSIPDVTSDFVGASRISGLLHQLAHFIYFPFSLITRLYTTLPSL